MRSIFFSFSFFVLLSSVNLQLFAQGKNPAADNDWKLQEVVLRNTPEAETLIRVGDIDNFGFGWQGSADPFCGTTPQSHPMNWKAHFDDVQGFDCILFSSKYNPKTRQACDKDNMVSSYDPVKSLPAVYSLPTKALVGTSIRNAVLQIFIDGLQAPVFCSSFKLSLNGVRITEGEMLFNSINQNGNSGKMISISVPEELFSSLLNGQAAQIKIDELKGAADGYAIDFMRLLVNTTKEFGCRHNIAGIVVDPKNNQRGVANARVSLSDHTYTTTNEKGEFTFSNIPSGFMSFNASAKGYFDGSLVLDPTTENLDLPLTISLNQGKNGINYYTNTILAGENIQLKGLTFSKGDRPELNGNNIELDKLMAFLMNYPSAEIELNSNYFELADELSNHKVAFSRAFACKNYLQSKGILAHRISIEVNSQNQAKAEGKSSFYFRVKKI